MAKRKQESSIKNQRFEAELRTVLGQIIRDVKDPRIPDILTITDTHVSPDREYATVYFSFMGEYDSREVLKGLKSAKGFIRSRLAQSMNLRVVPDLSFAVDESIERGARIENILKNLNKDKESLQ